MWYLILLFHVQFGYKVNACNVVRLLYIVYIH